MKTGKSEYKKYIFILIIAVFLEVFLFNWRFFEGMGYEPVTLGSFECGEGVEYKGDNTVFVISDKDAYIEFKNFSVPVENIYLDIIDKRCTDNDYRIGGLRPDFDAVRAELNLADGANRYYMHTTKPVSMPERVMVQNLERTKYLRIHSVGESSKLKINLEADLAREIIIREVSFNKQVPFSFNLIRFSVIYAALALIFALRRGSCAYNVKCAFDSRQGLIRIGIIALNMFLVMFILFVNPYKGDINYYKQYDHLADSFIEGRLYLDIEPSEALKKLENPYDPGYRLRDVGYEYFEWDTAYFNGRYYVYFGVLPVLVYYLPFKLIVGGSFPDKLGIMVNCWMYIIFAYALVEAVVKRWFKNIPFINYMLLSQVLICASGIVFALRRADLYVVPITMAMWLTVMGLYFWVSAGLYNSRLKQTIALCAGSLSMALVSACRPQFLIASFLAIPLFWNEVFRKRELLSKKSIGRSLAFALPYILVAAGVMWYNYARFGSVLDFGANYNLTTNDMTQRGFVLGRLPLGIFAYLLQPPNLGAVFPFVGETNMSTNYMGITINETMYGGALVSQPFLWLIFYTGACAKELKKKGLFEFVVLAVVLSVTVVCANTEMAGILHRYYMDFSYLLLLAAVMVALTLIEKGDNRVYGIVSLLCLGSIVYSVLLTFVIYTAGLDYNLTFYYSVASAVCFWL